jgi:hypothetical protein
MVIKCSALFLPHTPQKDINNHKVLERINKFIVEFREESNLSSR